MGDYAEWNATGVSEDTGHNSEFRVENGGSYRKRRHNDGRDFSKRSRHSHQSDGTLLIKQLVVSMDNDKINVIADAISNEIGRAEAETAIVSTVLSCVEAFPSKTATYALLIGIMANREATKDLASRILVSCSSRVSRVDNRKERLALRFIGASIKAAGLNQSRLFFDVLDSLLGDDIDEEEKVISIARELQVFGVLSVIPFFNCSPSAARCDDTEASECNNRLRSLCDRLSLVRRNSGLPARLAALPVAQQDREDPASDRVALGLAMTRQCDLNEIRDTDFDSMMISSSPDLAKFGECEFAELTEALNEAKLRIMKSAKELSSTGSVDEDTEGRFSTLLPLFPDGQPEDSSLFDVSAKQSLVERFLVREKALDILSAYHPRPKEASDALLSLNHPYQIVESIFSAMLQMPRAEHPIIYYADVLTHMCNSAPETVPAAIEVSFDQILLLEPDNLDPDALDRLGLWLVSHLQAFDLDWPWIKWKNVYQLESHKSIRYLVEQVIQRLDALGISHDALQKAEVPADILYFLPPPQAPDTEAPSNSPHFPSKLGDDLVHLISQKPTAGQLGSFLEERAPEPTWKSATRTELVIHAALQSGKPSFTHTRVALERVGGALIGLASNIDDDEVRMVGTSALKSAVRFWSDKCAWGTFAIGTLVDAGIVSVTLALKWLASSGSEFSYSSYWRRRAMEDVLARSSTSEERNSAIDEALGSEVDDSTDIWLSRRKVKTEPSLDEGQVQSED